MPSSSVGDRNNERTFEYLKSRPQPTHGDVLQVITGDTVSAISGVGQFLLTARRGYRKILLELVTRLLYPARRHRTFQGEPCSLPI